VADRRDADDRRSATSDGRNDICKLRMFFVFGNSQEIYMQKKKNSILFVLEKDHEL